MQESKALNVPPKAQDVAQSPLMHNPGIEIRRQVKKTFVFQSLPYATRPHALAAEKGLTLSEKCFRYMGLVEGRCDRFSVGPAVSRYEVSVLSLEGLLYLVVGGIIPAKVFGFFSQRDAREVDFRQGRCSFERVGEWTRDALVRRYGWPGARAIGGPEPVPLDLWLSRMEFLSNMR